MKLELTKKQYRRLLDMVYIGNWVLNSTRGEDRIPDYDEVESLLFSKARDEGMGIHFNPRPRVGGDSKIAQTSPIYFGDLAHKFQLSLPRAAHTFAISFLHCTFAGANVSAIGCTLRPRTTP